METRETTPLSPRPQRPAPAVPRVLGTGVPPVSTHMGLGAGSWSTSLAHEAEGSTDKSPSTSRWQDACHQVHAAHVHRLRETLHGLRLPPPRTTRYTKYLPPGVWRRGESAGSRAVGSRRAASYADEGAAISFQVQVESCNGAVVRLCGPCLYRGPTLNSSMQGGKTLGIVCHMVALRQS